MAAVPAVPTLLVFALLQPGGFPAALRPEFGAQAWGHGEVHSLQYNFTILLESGLWCDVQCQVDADNFLSYDCGSNIVKNVSDLGSRVSNTSIWEEQKSMLRDAGNLFKKKFLDVKNEYLVDSETGPVSMQGRLMCQSQPNGYFYGFWEFGLNGQMLIIFNLKHKNLHMLHPEGKLLKEKCEKDTDMIQFLKMMLMGDCKRWLKVFEEHRDKKAPSTTTSSHDPTLGVLGRSSTAVMNSAPSAATSSPSHTKDKNTEILINAIVIVVFLFLIVVIVLISLSIVIYSHLKVIAEFVLRL